MLTTGYLGRPTEAWCWKKAREQQTATPTGATHTYIKIELWTFKRNIYRSHAAAHNVQCCQHKPTYACQVVQINAQIKPKAARRESITYCHIRSNSNLCRFRVQWQQHRQQSVTHSSYKQPENPKPIINNHVFWCLSHRLSHKKFHEPSWTCTGVYAGIASLCSNYRRAKTQNRVREETFSMAREKTVPKSEASHRRVRYSEGTQPSCPLSLCTNAQPSLSCADDKVKGNMHVQHTHLLNES